MMCGPLRTRHRNLMSTSEWGLPIGQAECTVERMFESTTYGRYHSHLDRFVESSMGSEKRQKMYEVISVNHDRWWRFYDRPRDSAHFWIERPSNTYIATVP
jgi:hypothetical protein